MKKIIFRRTQCNFKPLTRQEEGFVCKFKRWSSETVSLPAIMVVTVLLRAGPAPPFPAVCFLIALWWEIPTLFSCDGLIFTQSDSKMEKGWRFLWLYFTAGLFLHAQHGPLTCQLQSFALFWVPYFLVLGWTRTASSLVPLVAVVGQWLSLSSEANSLWPRFFIAHPKAFIWILQGLIRRSAIRGPWTVVVMCCLQKSSVSKRIGTFRTMGGN